MGSISIHDSNGNGNANNCNGNGKKWVSWNQVMVFTLCVRAMATKVIKFSIAILVHTATATA